MSKLYQYFISKILFKAFKPLEESHIASIRNIHQTSYGGWQATIIDQVNEQGYGVVIIPLHDEYVWEFNVKKKISEDKNNILSLCLN